MRDTGIVHTVTLTKGELVNGRQRQATGAKAVRRQAFRKSGHESETTRAGHNVLRQCSSAHRMWTSGLRSYVCHERGREFCL